MSSRYRKNRGRESVTAHRYKSGGTCGVSVSLSRGGLTQEASWTTRSRKLWADGANQQCHLEATESWRKAGFICKRRGRPARPWHGRTKINSQRRGACRTQGDQAFRSDVVSIELPALRLPGLQVYLAVVLVSPVVSVGQFPQWSVPVVSVVVIFPSGQSQWSVSVSFPSGQFPPA